VSGDILTTAQRLGAKPISRNSPEHEGPCPMCGGKDRFSVNVRKQVFNCRGCGVGGDVIDLVRHVRGLRFVEAREWVGGESVSTAGTQRRVTETGKSPGTSTADALSLWGEGRSPRGTAAEVYLRSRKLVLGDDLAGHVLRWHPRLP
jgi:hypothetical protein